MDNENKTAPIIPSGTNPTVFGGQSFQNGLGQAAASPDNGQVAGGEAPQAGANNAPNSSPGITFAELAAKKGFKSPDDMAKAYAESESQKTRVEMSLSEMIKIRNDGQDESSFGNIQQPAAQPQTVEVNTPEDAMRIVEKVVKRFTRPLEDKLALQELSYKNPDFSQYANEMAKIVKENPGVAWDVAYRAAKFNDLDKKSREAGRQEAYQGQQQKQAVMAGGQRVTAPRPQRPIEELIKDKSVPFSEVQRIMKERFSQ